MSEAYDNSKAVFACQFLQVTVLIKKHEALLDEEVVSGMRAAADEKQAETLAEKGTNPEDLVRVSLVAKKDMSNQAPSKAQSDLADRKAKASSLASSLFEMPL